MCPQCDVCPYWNLSDACVYTKMAYLFDHPGTVFYSVFTAFWGTFVRPFRQILSITLYGPILSQECWHVLNFRRSDNLLKIVWYIAV